MEQVTQAFWQRVQQGGQDDCWPWTGSKSGSGYGMLRGKRATHLSLEIAGREKPDGCTLVRHHCDNPVCVNPAHLKWGTHEENMADMVRRKRHHANRKTECVKGHPLSGDNLIQRANGQRGCGECQRARDIKYRQTEAGRETFNAARRKRRALKRRQA